MEKIRKGNDIEVQWAIYAGYGINEAPYDLTGRNLTLYLRNQFGRQEVYEYTVDKHIIRFMYWGKDQKQTGTYSIELVENEGREGMHTVDECDAFTLVNHSCQTGGDSEGRVECIHLQFRANMGISIPNNGGGETPSIEVDDALSTTSTNPVQNKVVTSAINGLKDSVKALSQSVEQLEEKVDGYDDAISDAIAKSNSAAESVQTITSEIEKISEYVGTLSDKVDSLENGEISWTEVQ